MTKKEIEKIEFIVDLIIEKLKRSGVICVTPKFIYSEINSMLYAYYDNRETDADITAALNKIKGDKYFDIIPLFYSERYTLEDIAEIKNKDVSTIRKNKKRLCKEVNEFIHNS